MALTNSELNYYFGNEVQLKRDEIKRAKATVFPIVENIIKHVNKNDARFGGKPSGVGSAFQGLKTKQPDEYDFNILLEGLGSFSWVSKSPRYYNFDRDIDLFNMDTMPDVKIQATSVPLPDPPKGYMFVGIGGKETCMPVWGNSNDLDFSNDVIPFLVKKRLKELIQDALRSLGMRGVVTLGRKTHGPALTLRIPYEYKDITEITVDFAPTIPMHISFPSHVKWPRSTTAWPSRDKREEILKIGINMTAKKPFYWLYSFAECEKALMRDIDKDGGCRKKSHRIMKRLREQYWCKGSTKPQISSYHLKNILLWECEDKPHTYQWTSDRLAERVASMIETLKSSMRQTQLKQYFNPDVNLLKMKDAAAVETLRKEMDRIQEFLNNPSKYLMPDRVTNVGQ